MLHRGNPFGCNPLSTSWLGAQPRCRSDFLALRRHWLAVCAPLALCAPVLAQAQTLTVDKAVWTDLVDRETRSYARVVGSPAKLQKVTLWMQLRGSPELLQEMRKRPNGKVQIRHVWMKYLADGVEVQHDQLLDVGRTRDLQRLGHEVAAEGFFRWRVWSEKLYLAPGHWRVDVLWDNDDPVECSTAAGDVKPCSFSLEVR